MPAFIFGNMHALNTGFGGGNGQIPAETALSAEQQAELMLRALRGLRRAVIFLFECKALDAVEERYLPQTVFDPLKIFANNLPKQGEPEDGNLQAGLEMLFGATTSEQDLRQRFRNVVVELVKIMTSSEDG